MGFGALGELQIRSKEANADHKVSCTLCYRLDGTLCLAALGDDTTVDCLQQHSASDDTIGPNEEDIEKRRPGISSRKQKGNMSFLTGIIMPAIFYVYE